MGAYQPCEDPDRVLGFRFQAGQASAIAGIQGVSKQMEDQSLPVSFSVFSAFQINEK